MIRRFSSSFIASACLFKTIFDKLGLWTRSFIWLSNNKICESFIQNKDGDFVYYTASGNTFLTIVKNKFKGIPVRAYYDYKKKLYVFGDGFKFIHTELLQEMIRYTNVYSTKSWDRTNYK